MASAPQPTLPLFYQDLRPLNATEHGSARARTTDRAPWAGKQHAIPVTVDEFVDAQRSFPIVFSMGDNPVPLGLMGLNEGVNAFIDTDGTPIPEAFYLPAYVRRYPFMLAKLDSTNDTLTLCFDPTSDLIGELEEGNALFDGSEPSEHTKGLLEFCQRFEVAGQRTRAFVDELVKADLLMDGEVALARPDNQDQPFVYRGFKIINQDKLREIRGDQLRKWVENGLLTLIYAHLFSLDMIRAVFSRQIAQGKGPTQIGNPNLGV